MTSRPGVEADLARNYDAMDTMFRADRYAGRLGAEVVDWGGGWSQVRLPVQDDHHNFAAVLHGGVTFGVGDVAFAVASNSWGRVSFALAVDVQFLASAKPGEVLVAEATERHRTRRTGAYLVEVRAEDGALVGSLHAIVHRTGRWHRGDDAWSVAWRAAH